MDEMCSTLTKCGGSSVRLENISIDRNSRLRIQMLFVCPPTGPTFTCLTWLVVLLLNYKCRTCVRLALANNSTFLPSTKTLKICTVGLQGVDIRSYSYIQDVNYSLL